MRPDPHDLRTPLAVIRGYAELLQLREDEATLHEAPRRILEAADRLARELDLLVEASIVPDEATEPRTILIVDDDMTLRGLLRATLPEDVYEVLEAASAAAALELFEREDVELVVLDWRLPDGTGGDVLEHVKSRRPDLPVIVLTAEARVDAEQADAFLRKPFSPLELLDEIERLLR